MFGMREWCDPPSPAGEAGELHREILTAKPAQRPCRWVSWASMRAWLLQWQGYSIMRFDRANV